MSQEQIITLQSYLITFIIKIHLDKISLSTICNKYENSIFGDLNGNIESNREPNPRPLDNKADTLPTEH